jgi:hypothetical protein
VILLAAGSVGWMTRERWYAAGESVGVSAVDDTVRAPANVRVRVQVLNASKRRGLARRATTALRDRGFDVVETGTTSALRDSTLVLDRSGNAGWAQLVAAALGGAAVEARPDTSRYVDVTVLLGASWRPPAQPLYP